MRRRSERKNLMAEINITPFTDVVLVLLIIFMVTTPMIVQENIKINLPQAKKADNAPKNMTISITEKEEIFIDKVRYRIPSDLDKLKAKVSNMIGMGNYTSVTVNADKEIKYDIVIRVIDVLNQSGIKRVHLGIEQVK